MKLVDLTGQRFSRLVVIERAGTKWRCLCDCGASAFVMSSTLRRENTKSCGCLARERAADRCRARSQGITTPERRRWHEYRSGARDRGLVFELTYDHFLSLIRHHCVYCGGVGGGIDRVNSSLGYLDSNCIPCCKHCNTAKNNRTLPEFVQWARALNTYLGDAGGKP